MEIKKTLIKEIYSVNEDDMSSLYVKLDKMFGEENPFAKVNIGQGYYSWSDNRRQWKQMASASEIRKEDITEALAKVHERVASKIGAQSAKVLFTIPDESYIYYNDDDGDIRILLTGWGFKKPVNRHGGKDIINLKMKNPVNISFMFDGVRLPGYEFGIKLRNQIKRLKTDGNGIFHFDDLKPGEHFILIDIKSGMELELNVEEGKSNYEYDVTTYSEIKVAASYDGTALVAENVTIDYSGKTYDLTTDTEGRVSVHVPFHAGMNIVTKMRDLTKTETVNESGNEIVFSFEKELPPAIEADVNVYVCENGESAAGREVTITYGGQTYTGMTDGSGRFSRHVELVQSSACSVTVNGYETQVKELTVGVNDFKFDRTVIPERPEELSPRIRVEDEGGNAVADYPVFVEIDGITTHYISDRSGIVNLPKVDKDKTLKVTDGNNTVNTAEYVLNKETEEYVFTVSTQTEERKVKVMVRDHKNKPIKCKKVTFRQEETGRELAASLDESGDTYFAKDAFETDKSVTANIEGGERKYDPIAFTMDEDEDEYLLQENKPKSKWWMILVEILILLATAAALLMLWPEFEDIAREISHEIHY